MLKEFAKLTAEEEQLMFDAIPLITLLVAAADGKIDQTELQWAEKITSIRSFDYSNKLNDYYKIVGEQFNARLKTFLVELPEDSDERIRILSDKLAAVNEPMRKINSFDAADYYKNFLSFATHVAKASGGVMRFLAISPAEKEMIKLPMLDEFKK